MTDDKDIIITDDVLYGDPRIRGRRIAVYHVMQYVERGYSGPEIAEDLGLTVEEVEAAIEYQKLCGTHPLKLTFRFCQTPGKFQQPC